MKTLYIAEIGLNHFGKTRYINKFLKDLFKYNIDGVTIQVLKDSFYKKKFENFKLKEKEIINFIKKVKNKKKKVGIVTDDESKINLFAKYNVDFYKVLSSNITNINLIKKISNTKCKKIYLSTGTVSISKLREIIKKINTKKISLIHTSFNKKKIGIKLKRILILRKIFKLPICYGNHSKYLSSIIDVKKYEPYAIFFYVKLNQKFDFPDNIHAIKINKINKYINDN